MYFTRQCPSVQTELPDSMVTLREPGGGYVSGDGNFACRIHPAAKSVIGKPYCHLLTRVR